MKVTELSKSERILIIKFLRIDLSENQNKYSEEFKSEILDIITKLEFNISLEDLM